jgi:DNA modification methylase
MNGNHELRNPRRVLNVRGMNMDPNSIYCGDCLEVMRDFPDESVDLIYLDPPFFSNKKYSGAMWGEKEESVVFEDDIWDGDVHKFVNYMSNRLRVCCKVLKETGSIYVHCDWHASHYLKVMMDSIFGRNRFQNEIVWHYGLGGSSPKRFSRKHDIILFYTKSDKYTFNPLFVDATSQRMKGERKKMDDVWDVPSINNMAKERLGYPTQKPEALLERIIKASSNVDDLILDPFCGCGTAIAVAQRLGRRWIGIDIRMMSCEVIKKRLSVRDKQCNLRQPPHIYSLPKGIEDLKKMRPFIFQSWVCKKLNGTSNKSKTGDMGIDGWTSDNIPIQVKQSALVGRNIIDNFKSAIERAKKDKGIVVAFSFGRGAKEEAARLDNEGKFHIQLKTADELLKVRR